MYVLYLYCVLPLSLSANFAASEITKIALPKVEADSVWMIQTLVLNTSMPFLIH